ncbi:P22AR C-terminal domain-containing protein, partial [Escherichia coli]
SFVVGGPVGDSELLLCHGMVCVVGRMRDLILQLSKSSIYSTKPFTEALSLAARVPLEGEFIGKQEKKANELSAKEANSLVWLWDYANRSQALFRELYPALKQIQSNYSGRCYDYGHEFSYVIGMARDVLINHTRDVDINEPDGPTNLSAWMRLKNKELPPSVHNY